MTIIYSYACKDCAGMETCRGLFYAVTEEEVWQHMELHAMVAHQEEPAVWNAEDREYLKGLIKAEMAED